MNPNRSRCNNLQKVQNEAIFLVENTTIFSISNLNHQKLNSQICAILNIFNLNYSKF